MRRGVWNLRTTRRFRLIRRAFARGGLRFGFRLVHYSVQGNHIHLLGEASSTLAVSRAVKGLAVRIARALNVAMGTRGQVIAERYHLRVVRGREQAHKTLVYVLNNRRRHAAQWGERLDDAYVDPYSSSLAFDGWSRRPWKRAGALGARDPCPDIPLGVHPPRSDLLSGEWRLFAGSIDPCTIPGPFPDRSRV